jgi:hypothetical protein
MRLILHETSLWETVFQQILHLLLQLRDVLLSEVFDVGLSHARIHLAVVVELTEHVVAEVGCGAGAPATRREQTAHALVDADGVGGCGGAGREGLVVEEGQDSLLREENFNDLLSFLLGEWFIFKVTIASLWFVVIQVLLFVIGLRTLFGNLILHIINTRP